MTLKKLFFLIVLTLILLECNQSTTTVSNGKEKGQLKTTANTEVKVNESHSSIQSKNLFTISDAEKILGQGSHLTDSATTITAHVSEFRCTYTANSEDMETGKTGNIYFLFEHYTEVSAAKKVYASIKTSNENHEGVKELYDVGDEAYFHTDEQNFYFIIVRKDNKMFRMKVNKTTSKTSLDAFNMVAKNITAAL